MKLKCVNDDQKTKLQQVVDAVTAIQHTRKEMQDQARDQGLTVLRHGARGSNDGCKKRPAACAAS
eukprot:8886639-Karenia_brevis.AAC.1